METKFVIFVAIISIANCIYVPSDQTQSPTKTKYAGIIGMKTIDWQEQSPSEPIQVYQNYTNVKLQQHQNADNLRQIYQNNQQGQNYPQHPPNNTYPYRGNSRDPSLNLEPPTSPPTGKGNYYNPHQSQNQDDFKGSPSNYPIYNAPLPTRPAAPTGNFYNPYQNQKPVNFNSTPSNYPSYNAPPSRRPATATGNVYNPYQSQKPFNFDGKPSSNPNIRQGQNQNIPNQGGYQRSNIPLTTCTVNCQENGNSADTNPYFKPVHVIGVLVPQGQPVQVFNPFASVAQPTNGHTVGQTPFPNRTRTGKHHGNDYGGITITGTPFRPMRGNQGYNHNPDVNYGPQNHNTQRQFIVPENYYSGKLQIAPQATRSVSKCPSGATGVFPYEGSCNQFLNCWNGRGITQNCAPGTLFNPATKECDFPYKVNCKSGRSARLVENLSEKQQANCPNGFSGIIPHYADCSKFFNCANGQQHEMSCPPGTLFDFNGNMCDHAYKVYCANRQNEQLKTGTPNQQNRPSNQGYQQPQTGQSMGHSQNYNFRQGHIQTNAKCPASYSGLMAHPGDCSKFLNCANGMTYIQNCGPGTLFNQFLKVCDHPYNVQCQNSQNQQGQNYGGQNQQSPNYDGQSNIGHSNSYQPHSEQYYYETTTQRQQYKPTAYYQGQDQYQPLTPHWSADHGQVTESYEPVTENLDQGIAQLWNNPSQHIDEPYGQVTPSYESLATASSSYNNKNQWPPPFPSTDLNADYVFEDGDLEPEPDVNLGKKPPKTPEISPMNWCDLKGFECGNKFCIAPNLVCNGHKNCPNGADELDCSLSLAKFEKTAGTKLAVKEVHKIDNITLAWCARSCEKFNCKSFNYRKLDGTCYILDSNIGLSGALIILPMYDYYENQQYTINCDQIKGYVCTNQKCISKQQLCNGINDCNDGADEKGCTADAFDYQLRLVGGHNKHSGRLEVQAFGKTGYICDDMFGLKNADVACHELGFQLGAAEVRGNSHFAQDVKDNETTYLMDDVMCVGNESSLRDCNFNGWGKSNCQPQEIVGVICKTSSEICPKDHWQCKNNLECLPLAFVCDGVYDCSDKSDEDGKLCDKPTEVRLSRGDKGRVEVMHNGIWGTICDDDFNDDAAKVVCRQLGFTGNSRVVKDGYFGAGSGPIWLDQVFCKGNETILDECIHWEWGEHNCEHAEDVGIICNSSGSKMGKTINNQKNTFKNQNIAKLPEKCGMRSDTMFENPDDDDDAHFRVVAASLAKKGEYPWQASIRVKGHSKAAHWCGAIVISPMYVLTAAHCLVGYAKGAYFIVAGDYNVDKEEGSEQEAYMEDFMIHPDFGNGNKMNNDIALIRLKGNGFNITKEVQPICLPDHEYEYPIGLNCTISGFGSIESGKSKASKDLRAGWIPILSKEVCQMPHIYGAAITPGMMCAGFLENGVDACDGDSGGPLACLHEGVFKLFGITSWGQHCGYANKPGVYVNVSKYRQWIEETMKKLAV